MEGKFCTFYRIQRKQNKIQQQHFTSSGDGTQDLCRPLSELIPHLLVDWIGFFPKWKRNLLNLGIIVRIRINLKYPLLLPVSTFLCSNILVSNTRGCRFEYPFNKNIVTEKHLTKTQLLFCL